MNGQNRYFNHSGNEVVNATFSFNGQDYYADGNGFVSNRADNTVKKIVNVLYSEIGKPYVWGATGPYAFDCSGLVQYAYAQAGVSLPRVTYQQENAGFAVSLSNLKSGDLLFWGARGNSYHVAVYIGNWQMIEAPYPGASVHVASLNGWTPNFAVRVL
ncbi:C40 family peptidase [Furfurilactobacillus milii]|uniref:C40 family peptidase n=1 Tax=Furfurilactobacillus milii TaxID=2888272 RepID=UPI003262D22D